MLKRSLTIAGHRTSIALEPAFWDALEEMARARDLSLPRLIARIDETRQATNLSSAIRVAVLDWYRAGAFPAKAEPTSAAGKRGDSRT